ncbi:LysR family transcriptional regulator [Candidatus Bathyarchaeota archaeon]|nr:LysR family transcriptional regulator [Candidatus Bathyarchaeota archaeon]
MKNLRTRFRIWIELEEKKEEDLDQDTGRKRKETSRFICGKGVYGLLKAIKETGSLTDAAKKVGYSYKYAWDRTRKLKARLGIPAVEAHKGGKGGGGEMNLTPEGEHIIELYGEWQSFIEKCMEHKDEIEMAGLLD